MEGEKSLGNHMGIGIWRERERVRLSSAGKKPSYFTLGQVTFTSSNTCDRFVSLPRYNVIGGGDIFLVFIFDSFRPAIRDIKAEIRAECKQNSIRGSAVP